jgi:hypothetical protein
MSKHILGLGIVLGIVIFLDACSSLSQASLPTLIPADQLPTVIAMTLESGELSQSTATPTPVTTPYRVTATKIPTVTRTRYPTRTPTDTPTGLPTYTPTSTATGTALDTLTPPASLTPRPVIPMAAIRFSKPAPLSKVISPIQVEAMVRTGPDGIFRLELLGEDGRIISRKVLSYPQLMVKLSTELEFGISAIAEAARLQIVTHDQYGRVIDLNSVDLVLLAVGPADLPYSIDVLERIVIESPERDANIKGNVVTVYGLARPTPVKPYLIELITSSGGVVGSRLVAVTPEPNEGYGTFLVDVPYSVSQPTQVRLTISERGAHIPGPAYVTSRDITVSP